MLRSPLVANGLVIKWEMEQMLNFDRLCELEPRLRDLELRAKASPLLDNPRFCANEFWMNHKRDGIGQQLKLLVGWDSENRLPELRTTEAYDVAVYHLYELLPACRNCDCLRMPDGVEQEIMDALAGRS